MTAFNNNQLIIEAINNNYEWIQYNKQLRLIRSIHDDMYQMQSIIDACNSSKLPSDWFRNQSTKELLAEFELQKPSMGIPIERKSHEIRMNVVPGLKGYYVHRLLVNFVAIWASPKYAIHIAKLLDDIATRERNELEQTIKEQEKIIAERTHLERVCRRQY